MTPQLLPGESKNVACHIWGDIFKEALNLQCGGMLSLFAFSLLVLRLMQLLESSVDFKSNGGDERTIKDE